MTAKNKLSRPDMKFTKMDILDMNLAFFIYSTINGRLPTMVDCVVPDFFI